MNKTTVNSLMSIRDPDSFKRLRRKWSEHARMANSNTSSWCSCNLSDKCRGRFGLAWVTTLPHDCCEPVGWHFEMMDSPSKVKRKFKEMGNVINSPKNYQQQSKKTKNFNQHNFNCMWKEGKENKNRSFDANKFKYEKQKCCSTTTSHTQTDSLQVDVNTECNTENENNYLILQGLQNYFLREILKENHDQVQDQRVLKYSRSRGIIRKVFENDDGENRQILQRVTFNLGTNLSNSKNNYAEELSSEDQSIGFPKLHKGLSSSYEKQKHHILVTEQERFSTNKQIFLHEYPQNLCLSSNSYQKQLNCPTQKDNLELFQNSLSSQKVEEFCACNGETARELKGKISSKTPSKKRRKPLEMKTFMPNDISKNGEQLQVYGPPNVPISASKMKTSCSLDVLNSKYISNINTPNSKTKPCTLNNGTNNSEVIERYFSINEITTKHEPKISKCELNLSTSKSEVTEAKTRGHKPEENNCTPKRKASFVNVEHCSPSTENAFAVKEQGGETQLNACKTSQNVNTNFTKSVTCRSEENKRNALKIQVFAPTSIYGLTEEVCSSNFISNPSSNEHVIKITQQKFVTKENWLNNNKIVSSRVKTSIKEQISCNPEVEITEPSCASVKKNCSLNKNYTKGQINYSDELYCLPEETKRKRMSKICDDIIMPPTINKKANVKYYTYNHGCTGGSFGFEKQYTQSYVYVQKSWMPVEILKTLFGKLEKKIASSFSMPQEVSKIYNPTFLPIINNGIKVKVVNPYPK